MIEVTQKETEANRQESEDLGILESIIRVFEKNQNEYVASALMRLKQKILEK